MKKYMVVWERLANSGIIEVEANSASEAIEKVGYNPKYVKFTAIEICGEVKTIGERG